MLATGYFCYKPKPDYSGPDSFEYEISDGNGGTDTATGTSVIDLTVFLVPCSLCLTPCLAPLVLFSHNFRHQCKWWSYCQWWFLHDRRGYRSNWWCPYQRYRPRRRWVNGQLQGCWVCQKRNNPQPGFYRRLYLPAQSRLHWSGQICVLHHWQRWCYRYCYW